VHPDAGAVFGVALRQAPHLELAVGDEQPGDGLRVGGRQAQVGESAAADDADDEGLADHGRIMGPWSC
jgi:hypothetical protein